MDELTTLDQLTGLLAATHDRVVIFKHSTQCSISEAAHGEVMAAFAEFPAAADWVLLDLLEHRDVSNQVAKLLGIKHESPQFIVLEKGVVKSVLNHRAIKRAALQTLFRV